MVTFLRNGTDKGDDAKHLRKQARFPMYQIGDTVWVIGFYNGRLLDMSDSYPHVGALKVPVCTILRIGTSVCCVELIT